MLKQEAKGNENLIVYLIVFSSPENCNSLY